MILHFCFFFLFYYRNTGKWLEILSPCLVGLLGTVWLRMWISVKFAGSGLGNASKLYTAIHPEHLGDAQRTAMREGRAIVSGQQWTEKANSDFRAQPQIRSPEAGWPSLPNHDQGVHRGLLNFIDSIALQATVKDDIFVAFVFPMGMQQRSTQELTFVEQLFCARPARKFRSFLTAALKYNWLRTNRTCYWLGGILNPMWPSSVQLMCPKCIVCDMQRWVLVGFQGGPGGAPCPGLQVSKWSEPL